MIMLLLLCEGGVKENWNCKEMEESIYGAMALDDEVEGNEWIGLDVI